jgi:hypothetical protein
MAAAPGLAWAAERADMAINPVTAAAAPNCTPRPGRDRDGTRARKDGTDEGEGAARRRPCWGREGKTGVLSTPAKLAVGFGRVDCPACPERVPERGVRRARLHPKAQHCTVSGSSAPAFKLMAHEPPGGVWRSGHTHTRRGYVCGNSTQKHPNVTNSLSKDGYV